MSDVPPPTDAHPYPFNEKQGAPPRCPCEHYAGRLVVWISKCPIHKAVS